MLVPPLLVPASLGMDMPALAFVVLVLVAPLLRVVFGDVRAAPPEWSEWLASLLDWLPVACAVVYVGATAVALAMLRGADLPAATLAWFGASLWAVFVFGTCVAHELAHRSAALPRAAGRVLSGVLGYPLLEHEHRAHHFRNGDVGAGECPRIEESLWAFTARRLLRVVATAREEDMLMAIRRGHRLAGGLPVSIAAMVATAAAFTWAAGFAGLLLYAVVAFAVAWAVQAITYIQHWGLGQHDAGGDRAATLGWEDHCQLQAWLTLGLSFHQAHHCSSSVPYYRLQPASDAPKAPAGYIVLFFVSVVPPLWRRLMVPVLRGWQHEPGTQHTAGRRLIC